jgi:hypothetical protein
MLATEFRSAPLTWGSVLGMFVLPPAAAVAGWEISKHPLPAPAWRDARLQAPPRPHARAGLLPAVVLGAPLLTGSF